MSEKQPTKDFSSHINIEIAYKDWKFEIPFAWINDPSNFEEIYKGIASAVGESNVKFQQTENRRYGGSITFEVDIIGTPENFMDKLNQVFMSLMIAQNFITYVGHTYAIIKIMDKEPIVIEVAPTEAQHGFPMFDKIEALSDKLTEAFKQIVSPSPNVERIDSMIENLRKSIISSDDETAPESGTEKTESLFAKLAQIL